MLFLALLKAEAAEGELEEEKSSGIELGGEMAVAREGEGEVRIELKLGYELTDHFSLELFVGEELPFTGDEDPRVFILAGPVWTVGPLKAAFSLGPELSKLPLRGSVVFQYEVEHFQASGSLEYGLASGPWAKALAAYRFKIVDLGVHAQLKHGVGPTAIFNLGEVHPWITPMYNVGVHHKDFTECISLLAGVNWMPKRD
jgi:hypothetical protein